MGPLLHFIRTLDVGIYYFLTRFAGNGVLCRLARVEETDNFVKGAIFFAILWHHWFRSDSEQAKRRTVIVATLTGSIVAIVIARALAFMAPFRLRPIDDPAIVHPAYALSFAYNFVHWSAFPSDTAAYFFSLAIGIAWLSRRTAIPILAYTLAWICLPRMFLGIHYASDVAVGMVIAFAVVSLSIRSKLVDARVAQPLLAVANRTGGWFYAVAFLISFEMATVFEGSRNLGSAVLHAVAAGLHFRPLGAPEEYRPLTTWGGLVGTAICLALLAYFLRRLSGKFHALQRHHSVEEAFVRLTPRRALPAHLHPRLRSAHGLRMR